MPKNIHLLAIDAQNDFCDPKGALFVPGADKDVKRLAKFVKDNVNKIDDVHVTLDCHQENHIAHPHLWINSKGEHPKPFTLVSKDDVEKGVWNPVFPGYRDKFLNYVKTLEANGRYQLVIWPPHCIIGSWGNSLDPDFSDAIRHWQVTQKGFVNYVTKGSNPWTEHYSAVKADVEDSSDPSTKINTGLIKALQSADVILISGQASSHCVYNSFIDIKDNFGVDEVKKLVILEDCMSPVTGFEHLHDKFFSDAKNDGVQICKSIDFFN